MNDSPNQIGRVLVVDDHRPISDSLVIILSHKGFVAKSAASGEEAIEVARSFMPDLLISDVVMEGISGIEAANEILTFLPTCKVILFSGQANILDAFRHSRTPSNYQILSKPISPDVLIQRIAELS